MIEAMRTLFAVMVTQMTQEVRKDLECQAANKLADSRCRECQPWQNVQETKRTEDKDSLLGRESAGPPCVWMRVRKLTEIVAVRTNIGVVTQTRQKRNNNENFMWAGVLCVLQEEWESRHKKGPTKRLQKRASISCTNKNVTIAYG